MRRILYLIILCAFSTLTQAQHTFQNTSLSEALIELDKSSKHYSISFVYDELEDFTVTKTIRQGRSLPDAVRDVCGFYPIRVSTKGHEIFVECVQKDRTKLIGRLIGPDRQPVAYANITLFPPSDSTYLGGGVSNEAGDFVIPCNAVKARVRISCVGFKTIDRQMSIDNVGIIRMQMENNYLSGVSVSGRMPIIRSEADRLQYIVGNDEFAKGHNAFELLSRVPMVSMAGGRAMILGKGPANFMLNGRISEIGNEAIQQKLWTMRAEDIERIEVISIPSGRYQTDLGSGGYINIVLQRDQTLGWRGDVSTEAGISDDWSGRWNGSVSYASEKFDMTIDAHGGRTAQTTDNLMDYHILDYNHVLSDSHSKQTDKDMAANMTLRYLPTKNLELGGMLSWQLLWPDKTTDCSVTDEGLQSISEADLAPNDNTCTKSLTAYCDWHLDSKGKLLNLTYNNYKKDEDTRSDAIYTDPLSEIPNQKRWGGYQSDVDYHIQSGRLDLSLPFNIATIDAGASYTSIKNQGGTQQTPKDGYPLYLYQISSYNYQEKRKAAYLSLYREWDRYTIKAGLRYVHINLDRGPSDKIYVDPYYMIYGTPNSYNIFHRDYWLPSLSFSSKPKEGHQISLVWGTNCIYPNFYDLNPIFIYKSGYEAFEGNPILQPSRTSNIELSYHNHKGFYACAYHHHASNIVERNTQMTVIPQSSIPQLFGYFAISFPQNKGRCNLSGLYLRYQHQITPNLLVTAEGDVSYHDYSTTYNTDAPSKENLYGWRKQLAISSDWYLNRQHTLLLNARYQHRFSDYSGLTETSSYGYFHFALRYSMMDDRLKLSLVANDPFHQYITDETIYNGLPISASWPYKQKIQYSHTNHHAHYVGITASYSIGGKKVRRIQHDMKDTESQRALPIQ